MRKTIKFPIPFGYPHPYVECFEDELDEFLPRYKEFMENKV